MANRRKFIAGLGALATGSAAAMGTGAFTSVSADRGVNVAVADDGNAFLALRPTDSANGDYTVVNEDGTLGIDLSEANPTGPDGAGVNNNAYTVIRDIFTITNQGTQDVYVGVDGSTLPDELPDDDTDDDKAVDFFSDDADKGAGLGVGPAYVGDADNLTDDDPLGLLTKGVKLAPGETLDRCGMLIYTFDRDEIGEFDATVVAASAAELGE